MYINKLSGLCYSYVVDNEVRPRCPFSRRKEKKKKKGKLSQTHTDPFSNVA